MLFTLLKVPQRLPWELGLFGGSAAAAEGPRDALQQQQSSGDSPVTSPSTVPSHRTHREPKAQKSLGNFTPAAIPTGFWNMGGPCCPRPGCPPGCPAPAPAAGVGCGRAKGTRTGRSGACDRCRCPMELITVMY